VKEFIKNKEIIEFLLLLNIVNQVCNIYTNLKRIFAFLKL